MLSFLPINIEQNIDLLGIVSLQWYPSIISIVILFPKTVYIYIYRIITVQAKIFHSTVIRTLDHLVPPNKIINIFSLDQAEESNRPGPHSRFHSP